MLFYERAGTHGVNAINALNWSLKRVWLVARATILTKPWKIYLLVTNAIADNWSFFSIFKQTFWSLQPNFSSGFVNESSSVYLREKGIKAVVVGSDSSGTENKEASEGKYKLAFTTPKALFGSHRSTIPTLKNKIEAVFIDEVHCVTKECSILFILTLLESY